MHLAFNPVLRDRLRRLAERQMPEELESFSRRAVDELSAQAKHVSAARLAVDLGDEALIVKVVEACDSARMMFGEGVGSLRKILRLIPPGLQRRQLRIGYARIICWIKSGDLADAVDLFDELEALLRTSGVPVADLPGPVRLDRQLCRLMIATYVGLPLTLADIEAQRRLAEVDETLAPMIESMTDTLLCYVLQREGRFEEAKAAAERAMIHANHVGSAYAALFMFCDIAMILGVQGRVAEAFETFQAGERACLDVLRQDERLAMIRDVARLELQHELDPDDMSQAERLRTICRRLPRLEGWPDVFAAAYRTYSEKLAISGDLEAALAVVRTGLDFAADQRIAPLALMLTAQRVVLLAWARRLEEARAALAELRSMGPGPTPSWREQEVIAEALAALDLAEGGREAVEPLQAAQAAARRTGARRSEDRFTTWLEQLGRPAARPQASPFRRTPRLIEAFLAWRSVEPGRAAARDDRPELFTAHERRVLEKLGRGMSDKAIGLELGISPHGVRYHLKRIYAQLNVSSRRQALDRAKALGIGAPY
jgi:LuxR family maltose regulon positive regulatory protein